MQIKMHWPNNLLLISCALLTVNALGLPGSVKGVLGIGSSTTANTELTIHPSIKDTINVLETVSDLPSCNLLASAALIHSCAAFEDASSGILDQVKTVYATRLAVCELLDAHVKIPDQCLPFKPSADSTRKIELRGHIKAGEFSQAHVLYPKYEGDTEKHVKECTNALHDTPQFWTSFSNSKQNAMFICHTMQVPLQKDDLLKQFSMVMNVTDDMMDSFDIFDTRLMTFVDVVATTTSIFDGLRQGLTNTLSQSTSELRELVSMMHKIQQGMSRQNTATELAYSDMVTLRDMTSMINEHVSGASSSVEGLNNALDLQQHAIKRSTDNLDVAVAVLIHNIEASSDNITAILNEALETASSLTVSLNSMQGVFDVFLAMIPSVSTILNVLVFGFCGAYTFVVMCVLSWSAFETYTGLRLSLVFASTLGLSTVATGIVLATIYSVTSITADSSVMHTAAAALGSATSFAIVVVLCHLFVRRGLYREQLLNGPTPHVYYRGDSKEHRDSYVCDDASE